MPCTYRNRTETVLAYVRQELNPQAQEAFEAHYFVCRECASEVLFYEKTVLTMQGQGDVIFARPKTQHTEAITRFHHFLNRLNADLAWRFGEGGAARALAGYALLIVFLSAGSLWLMKMMDEPSLAESTPAVAVASNLRISHSSSSGHTASQLHIDWPQGLKLTEDAVFSAQLEQVRTLYQLKKDYAAAGEALSRLSDSLARVDEIKLFLAICWMHENKEIEAEALLMPVSANANSACQLQARDLLRILRKR